MEKNKSVPMKIVPIPGMPGIILESALPPGRAKLMKAVLELGGFGIQRVLRDDGTEIKYKTPQKKRRKHKKK